MCARSPLRIYVFTYLRRDDLEVFAGSLDTELKQDFPALAKANIL